MVIKIYLQKFKNSKITKLSYNPNNMSKFKITPDQSIDALKAAKESGQLKPEHIKALEDLISDVRPDVTDKLSKGKKDPEAKIAKPDIKTELIKKLDLEVQYVKRLETLRHYGFLSENGETKECDVSPPSFEKTMSMFKPEELDIARHFQKPVFLLIPETSFSAKVQALNAYKQGIQKKDTYVHDNYIRTDSGSHKIIGWRAVIVDGAQEIEPYEGDLLHLRDSERIKNRQNVRKPNEKGMDRHKYILLMMEAISNGDPIDKKVITLLDDDPAFTASYLPKAKFYLAFNQVCFTWCDPPYFYDYGRFRSSVGGDILIV